MNICICGGAGFIGSWLAEKLAAEGHRVRIVDLKHPDRPIEAEVIVGDLRNLWVAELALFGADEVYQLAADFGGMGWIDSMEHEIVRNNTLINMNVLRAAVKEGVKRYFFSSSVCVYRDMMPGELPLTEEEAYPAFPDNEYGWEKLFAERCAMTYARHYPIQVRIARFENTYGPHADWDGGREKAPAALCRKAALAKLRGERTFPVWGDGSAIRSYTWIGDLVDGIVKLMRSDLEGPVNLGSSEYVPLTELVDAVVEAAGGGLQPEWVPGPVGVRSRNFSKARAESIGAVCPTRLRDGIKLLYTWIEEQVRERYDV